VSCVILEGDRNVRKQLAFLSKNVVFQDFVDEITELRQQESAITGCNRKSPQKVDPYLYILRGIASHILHIPAFRRS